MSELTGRDRGFLSRLERGLDGSSPDTLRRIATVLDVPLAAIDRDRS
jgi:transcriptional regulator with XRE-family HTH domain